MEITNSSNPTGQNDILWPVTANSNKANVAAPSPSGPKENQGATKTPMAQMLTISSSIDYITDQLKSLLTSFPPYFPVGSPQRVDLIKGIKGLQEKIEKAPVASAMKKELIGPRLSNQATDDDITAALKGLTSFRNLALQHTGANGKKEAGTVLNLKI